tara:strand:- start:805 stop:1560 length:756 start_codon:yes stop_codon:yes gene_type:complete
MRIQLARFLRSLPNSIVKKYNTILNFAIFFCSSIILSLIFALVFEKRIEEKQINISENLLALEYIDEWNQYLNMTDLYAFSWKARYLAEKSLYDFSESDDITEENIAYLKECALFPFYLYLPDSYMGALIDINRIGFPVIDNNTLDNELKSMAPLTIEIDALLDDNDIEIGEFNNIISAAHSKSYQHKISINNIFADKIYDLQMENVIYREKINHYNSISRNIVLASFLIQVLIYLLYNVFEVKTYSRNEK